ncbi:prolyl oligopeptidase family serine peptidase [Nonomuraea typhae]|uniref:Prolyl oligopeptidase family serine peptidase n=1 Tax=Nonomuraea typhae TaxID=2603600 RepID=A0ABW7YXF1_9ACTN
MSESFPRMSARTRRFTLGVPRGFTISPDGGRVVFLRTQSGVDPVTCLWELDTATHVERLVVDPRKLSGADEENLPPEERARRERSREQAGGVVAYSTDADVTLAAFALAGGLYLTELASGRTRRIETAGAVVDPRLSPGGQSLAYVSGGAFHVHDLASGRDRTLAAPESPTVTYGLAEFIAAEELERMRGYWWSPDGDKVLVERADEAPVPEWYIADPANPDRPAVPQRYPAAGTRNARVELFVLGLDGSRVAVPFDDEYLAAAAWDSHALSIVTMARDQKSLRLLTVDPLTGASTIVREERDPAWVEAFGGVPAHLDDGSLVWIGALDGGNRLFVGGRAVTPPTLQVREVLGVDHDSVLFRASGGDPSEIQLWTWDGASLLPVSTRSGVFTGRMAGGVGVLSEQTLDNEGVSTTVVRRDGMAVPIPSLAERPGLDLRVSLGRSGRRELSTAVVLPSWYESGSGKLPVLMDPYGGPHAQRVLSAHGAYLASQWFAEQGFAVIVADGRGTPGRGPAWERTVLNDLAGPVLEDQIDALHGVAEQYAGDLDLTKVAIRGWSFGGYLAALAVLRRPDVFHAAVAGAPVTDWRLYDTAYTERYLGHPDEQPEVYDQSSLFADAVKLERPLLLIHGLADDNVVAAHTLRLSSALLAAGRQHSVLPLSGVTHMTPQEVVAENLLLLQVEFLKRSLGV